MGLRLVIIGRKSKDPPCLQHSEYLPRRNLRLLGWAGTEHKEAKFPSYYNCQTRLESFSSWLTAACVLDHPLGHYLLWGVGGDVG